VIIMAVNEAMRRVSCVYIGPEAVETVIGRIHSTNTDAEQQIFATEAISSASGTRVGELAPTRALLKAEFRH
jgi:hypothetical protein